MECHRCLDSFDHGSPINLNITANQICGVTGGKIGFCDDDKFVELVIDKAELAAVGLVKFEKFNNTFLGRIALSAQENDETTFGFNNNSLCSTVTLRSGLL